MPHITCQTCGGTGWVEQAERMPIIKVDIPEKTRECPTCGQPLPSPKCLKCGDTGQIPKSNGKKWWVERCDCGAIPPQPQFSYSVTSRG